MNIMILVGCNRYLDDDLPHINIDYYANEDLFELEYNNYITKLGKYKVRYFYLMMLKSDIVRYVYVDNSSIINC